jgi:hypothetical protein
MRWRFLLLVFGLTLILVGGVQEIALWRVAAPKPQTISCEALGRTGPGDNAHVVLTDFVLCQSAFVYEERGGRWTVAWVPAVPRGTPLNAGQPPPDFRVLVKIPSARSMSDIVQVAQAPTLEGIVVNSIERLGDGERATLQRSYPRVDFERCQIFELDRRPAGWLRVIGSLAGGALLILYMLWTLLAGQGTVRHGPVPQPQPPRAPAAARR